MCPVQPTPPAEITTREAADILGYSSPSTVNRMVREGRFCPTRKLPGKTGAMLFDLAEVRALRDRVAAS